jgi:hypothetical protein
MLREVTPANVTRMVTLLVGAIGAAIVICLAAFRGPIFFAMEIVVPLFGLSLAIAWLLSARAGKSGR